MRFAALRRTPVFSLVVIASLALAIGINAAVLTSIDSAMLRKLPVCGMLAIAMLAAWFPARRAARLHPVDAVRHE